MKTCEKLNIRTVAVFSDIDRNSQHVLQADEAFDLQGSTNASSETYLNSDKILDICIRNNVQAVHPGYGFLSENADFSRKCLENGIQFIGPPENCILSMGSKSESKKIMIAAGVPCTPGYHNDEDQSMETFRKECDKIGYPVMLKAILGGGGKGMKICEKESDLEMAVQSCKREAMNAVGDDRLIIEKYLRNCRHIEFQIFADQHGNVVHLFERDCSTQRRAQKVLEEAPAPKFPSKLREKMGKAAVDAAKAVGYVGAGTVEFMLDLSNGNIVDENTPFYFMEMNTRLQVEHPVTEMITDLDLVEMQIRVAAGEKLPFLSQDDVKMNGGHSVEARIYAENPLNEFLPQSGIIEKLILPNEKLMQDGIRIDKGIVSGDQVSMFYDPMIAKVIAFGSSRLDAIQKLTRALEEFKVIGLKTNVGFVLKCLATKDFQEGNVSTELINENKDFLFSEKEISKSELNYLCALKVAYDALSKGITSLSGFRTNAFAKMHKTLRFDIDSSAAKKSSKNIEFELLSSKGKGSKQILITFTLKLDDHNDSSKETFKIIAKLEGNFMHFEDGTGRKSKFEVVTTENEKTLNLFGQNGEIISVSESKRDFSKDNFGSSDAVGGSEIIISPMPGKITKVFVKENESVKKGDVLFVMEAMKMEHNVVALQDGKVGVVNVKTDDFVGADFILTSVVI